MEDDGFKLVTGKRAAKNFRKIENGMHVRVDGNLEEIQRVMQFANQCINQTGIGKRVLETIEKVADDARISKIILLGNGHFDRKDEAGSYQLALCQFLSNGFAANVVFQEPVCSSCELEWLNGRGIEVRVGPDAKIETSTDELTILFMIHGAHEILEEFLEFNSENFRNLLVIGNNYWSTNWQCTKNKEKFKRISELTSKCSMHRFPAIFEPHNTAFSDTVIMSWKR